MNNNGSKGFFKKLGILVLAAFAVISCSLTAVITGKAPVETVKAEDTIEYPKLGDDWYKDWNYTVDDENDLIKLTKYNGDEVSYKVPSAATINGKVYKTKVENPVYRGMYPTGDHFDPVNINNLAFESGVVFPEDCLSMFLGNRKLMTVDLSRVDTSNTTSMDKMFENCRNLKSINLHGLDTNKVKDMSEMFGGCVSLKELDLTSFYSNSLSTLDGYSFYGMFDHCESLENIKMFNLGASNKEVSANVTFMFSYCKSLKSVDLTDFHVRARNQVGMFKECSSLRNLDLRSLIMNDANGFDEMFAECSSLINLDISNIGMKSYATREAMFRGCDSLKSITLGKNWTATEWNENVDWDFTYKYNPDFPVYTADKTNYTGKWTRNDENNHKDAITAEQLMRTYDGETMAGTWVAERKEGTETPKPSIEPTPTTTPVPSVEPTPTPSVIPTAAPSSDPNKDSSIYKAVQDISWPLFNDNDSFTNSNGKKRGNKDKWIDILNADDYKKVYKTDDANVKILYNSADFNTATWSGECYGLALLACLQQNGQINIKNFTGKDGNVLSEFGYSGLRKNLLLGNYYYADKDLTKLLDYAQVIQGFNTMDGTNVLESENMPNDIISKIEEICKQYSIMVGLPGHEVVIPKGSIHHESTVKYKDQDVKVPYFVIYDPDYPQLTQNALHGDNNLLQSYYESSSILGFDTANQMAVYVKGDLKTNEMINWKDLTFQNPALYNGLFYSDRLAFSTESSDKLFLKGENIAVSDDSKKIIEKKNGNILYRAANAILRYWADGNENNADQSLSWIITPKSKKSIQIGDGGGSVVRFSDNDNVNSTISTTGPVDFSVDNDNTINLVSNSDNVNVTITTTTNNGTESQTTTGVLNKGEYLNLKEDPSTHRVYGETNSTSNTKPSGDVNDSDGNKKDNVIFGKIEPSAEPTDEPAQPTASPSEKPAESPSAEPTDEPTVEPTTSPTAEPTTEPTQEPSAKPTPNATSTPTASVKPDAGKSGKTASNGTGNIKSNNKANSTQQNKKSDKKESPNTGDRNNVGIYAGLFAVAVVAGVAIIFIRRKHA